MSNPSVENVYTRQEAKELTKKHFWKLVAMMAIVYGIAYAISLGGTALLTATGNEAAYMVGYVVVILVVSLLSSGLMLGLLTALIDLARGQQSITVGTVFSRMGQLLKAFGLGLWVGLKTLLWMLPGYVLLIAGIVMTSGMSTSANPEEGAAVMTLVMLAGMVLIFALVFPAAYRYMLSTFILADHPETGVFECVKQSKALMKGHKWQAFKLIVPIILVMYVVMLVVAVAVGALGSIVGNSAALTGIMSIVMLIVMFALILYYCLRMYLCYAIFYLKRVAEMNPAAQPAAEDDITSTITF